MDDDSWIDEAINNWSMSTTDDGDDDDETDEPRSDFERLCGALREVGFQIPDEVRDYRDLVISIESNPPRGGGGTSSDVTDSVVMSTFGANRRRVIESRRTRGVQEAAAEMERLSRKSNTGVTPNPFSRFSRGEQDN